MTKPEGEARMDCRDAGLLREAEDHIRAFLAGRPHARAAEKTADAIRRALSAPVPTGEGEARTAYGVPTWLGSDYCAPKPAQGEGVEALREKVARIIEDRKFRQWTVDTVDEMTNAILAALATGKGE